MSTNTEMVKCLLQLKNSIEDKEHIRRVCATEAKLPTNQKDAAQRVKDYVYEKYGRNFKL